MTHRNNRRQLLLMAVALIVMALVSALSTQTARAQCCTTAVTNAAPCTFQIRVTGPGWVKFANVLSGYNDYSYPGCPNVTFSVVDACGNSHQFPQNVGDCIIVYIRSGCCVHICKDGPCDYGVFSTMECVPCV